MGVAIKVVRNNDMMVKAAQKEVAILEKLKQEDPKNKQYVIRLLGTFNYRNHYCLVFECMWDNLRIALKKHGSGRGLGMPAVHSWSKQLFIALRLLRKCNLIHADLKPDNVLMSNKNHYIKVADMGSCMPAADNDPTPYLVSRFYRAPEIIFGCRYSPQVDVWSAGCMLGELLTGRVLFTPNLDFQWSDVDKATGEPIVRVVGDCSAKKSVEDILTASCTEHKGDFYFMKKVRQLADLISKCLIVDPEKRIVPDEALKHPFIVEPVTNPKNAAPQKPKHHR